MCRLHSWRSSYVVRRTPWRSNVLSFGRTHWSPSEGKVYSPFVGARGRKSVRGSPRKAETTMLNVRWASRCKQSMIPPTTPSDVGSDRRTSLEMRSSVETHVILIETPTLQIRAGWLSLGATQLDPKRCVADSSFAAQIEIQRSY